MLACVSAAQGVDIKAAVEFMAAEVRLTSPASPDLVIMFVTAGVELEPLRQAVMHHIRPRTLHGSTSFRGILANGRALMPDDAAYGLLAIWDTGGDFGTGSARVETDAREAARAATLAALARANRVGEVPEMLFLSTISGHEEEALAGIIDVLGPKARLLGASSASNVEGQGAGQFTLSESGNGLVLVTALFPSAPISVAFQCGYAPSGPVATVTASDRRRLFELDGRPSAIVWNEWRATLDLPPIPIPQYGSVNILNDSTFSPLGRLIGTKGDMPEIHLLHPSELHSDGSMSIVANIEPGEKLWLMKGTSEALERRGPAIVAAAVSKQSGISKTPLAGIVVFCSGSFHRVQDRIDDIAEQIDKAMKGAPHIGVFSYGEQGNTADGSPHHANLMIAAGVLEHE